MGMIGIEVSGSFPRYRSKYFSAMDHGHAQAVAEAIKWLADTVLPEAIQKDHVLQTEGNYPEKGFGQ